MDRNDYCYSLFSLTRVFAYAKVSKEKKLERRRIGKRLIDWFGAADTRDANDQIVVRELRQGKSSPGAALLDLAQAAERRGDMDSVQSLYDQAISRNPRSCPWHVSPRSLVDTDAKDTDMPQDCTSRLQPTLLRKAKNVA